MVEGVDDGRQILAHIRLQIPGAVKELLGTVVQVGGDYVVEIPLGIVVVEFLQAVGEQAEGAAEDDPGGIPLLQSPGGVQDALPGGDHVVHDDHGLAGHGAAQEFVGHDGISAVHHLGVIPALVEHAHVHAQVVGQVHGPVHGALVGADDHQGVLVQADGDPVVEQGLHKLVGGHKVVKAAQGDGVLHPGVVGIEGDDVAHAHLLQLLQGHGAVQGFPLGALVLPALVEEGHDHVDPVGGGHRGGDDPL